MIFYKNMKLSIASSKYFILYRTPIFIFLIHSLLCFGLLIISNIIFQNDIPSSLWSTYTNDSWKFLANTLNLSNPPYPYHLLGTSLHIALPYFFLAFFFPLRISLFFAVILIQYFFSFLILLLLHHFFQEVFCLDQLKAFNLTIFFDFIILGPFLILGTSEILFLFYQLLTWFLFVRKNFFLASLSTAMVFALRFNGAFFVLSMMTIFFFIWFENKRFSLKFLIKILFTSIVMFLIGFSTFIWCAIRFNDFWLPLNTEKVVYKQYEGYAAERIITPPFTWLVDYFRWILLENNLLEYVMFLLVIFFLILEFLSLFYLRSIKISNVNSEWYLYILIIFISGFLGLSIINSGRNFTRFILFIFPILPCLPILYNKLEFSSRTILAFQIVGLFICLITNLIWWSFATPCLNCLPDF